MMVLGLRLDAVTLTYDTPQKYKIIRSTINTLQIQAGGTMTLGVVNVTDANR